MGALSNLTPIQMKVLGIAGWPSFTPPEGFRRLD